MLAAAFDRWLINITTDAYMHSKSSTDPFYISVPGGVVDKRINIAIKAIEANVPSVTAQYLSMQRMICVKPRNSAVELDDDTNEF